MKRQAMQDLIKWKNAADRKPLILQGARQVGKTWLMREFGKLHFPRTAYFVFEKNPRLQRIFTEDLDVNRILNELGILAGFKITPQDLIIFDEVQECPDAITSLKYFCEEKREYHIIAAGSLLGVTLHGGVSFPVGKVDLLTLYPLNFYEFLTAIGQELIVKELEKGHLSALKNFHLEILSLLRRYVYIGGMPEVVLSYVKEEDFQKVRTIQKRILSAYQKDFSKHISEPELSRVLMVWQSIPAQLGKENKKFIYGTIRHGARSKEFERAILWMEMCGLVYKVHRVKKPALPLSAYQDLAAFKLFMVDVGLLSAMASLDVKILLDGDQIFREFKGSLAEQYVLQELMSLTQSHELVINYWATDTRSNELDFVLQYANEIIPVEVKASTNLNAKSLTRYIEKFSPAHALRFSSADYKQNKVVTDYPLYSVPVFFTKKL